jgi:hypothetical protein
MEELKDPAKRKTKSEEKKAKTEDKSLDVDEEDYVPVKGSGMTVLVGGEDEDDSGTMPLAQREIIMKEIAGFRERSIRRDSQSIKFRSGSDRYDRDDDDDIADEELERRRLEKKRRDLEALFADVYHPP